MVVVVKEAELKEDMVENEEVSSKKLVGLVASVR